ncbi:lovastatin nonaketide synthase [Apiospora marii]|uniref:Lovastatin nonaketide synthase n=1 Tax=Apiospora marii TaxID=335849 RepID=A0ABR1RJW6_9PEZI
MAPKVNSSHDDPSVIIGAACRVPGARNPSELWDTIVHQRDLRRKMPEDRFNVDAFYHPDGAHKGVTNARYAYFLEDDIRDFDAGFFGISGKEAEAMDPQQRLLLEVVYEALENAGIALGDISGSSASVFCGSFTNDYNSMLVKDLESYPKYMVTGTGNAILSNRISYFYNLHGTSVTLDTACSSSLVCFHLANKSIASGEADISIVAGSALHFDPNIFVTMTDLGMLSTDGRCRAFDAAGSGYVRGEGVCAVILKRQSLAQRDGNSIRAVVRATGSNHDGRKQGITLPNSVAQESLMRETYESAGIDPLETQYFEAHGTGTKAGDPIETRAIGAVFGPGRESPLYVGSVKTNIGHLEGASGVAGLIKAMMSLERGQILPNMHFQTPNREIDFEAWRIKVPQGLLDWERPAGGVRRASVNSFGYGGTNAHVILEEYIANDHVMRCAPQQHGAVIANGVHDRPYLLPLSSHSAAGGQLLETRLAEYLQHSSPSVPDLAHTLSGRRNIHAYRSFVISSALDEDSTISTLSTPRASAPWVQATKLQGFRLGFVFTGQGAQWFAMGRQLIKESPIFRQTLEACDGVLQSLPDAPSWTILEGLSRSQEDSLLGVTLYSQTICTALQIALVDLLRGWNITPSAVVGHSSGEIGAAYAAGILSFENAMIAAYYRGVYMSASTTDDSVAGAMMAAGLSEPDATRELAKFTGRLTIAAVNSPSMVTISGDEDAILELKTTLTAQKVFARQLQVNQAFHSHHMLPLAPAYESALRARGQQFEAQPATCRMFSSVTSRLADHKIMGPSYWAKNMTNMVRFTEALTGILLDENDEQNIDGLVEIGPHPALKGPCKEIAKSLNIDIPYVASLARGTPDFEAVLNMAGQLFSLGYPVDLKAVNQNLSLDVEGQLIRTSPGARLVDFPTYAWDHKKYWSETRVIREHRQRRFRHSLLGHIVPGSVQKYPRWRNYLRLSEIPWLSDHVIDGKIVFPGAGYISMAIEAAIRQASAATMNRIQAVSMKDVVIKAPLILSDNEVGTEIILELRPVTLSAKSRSDVWYEFAVFSFGDASICQEHCHGAVCVKIGDPEPVAASPGTAFDPESLQVRSNQSRSSTLFYQKLAQIGLEYGQSFQLLHDQVQSGPGFAISALHFDPSTLPRATEADETCVHPTLLDASFHVMFGAIESCLGRQLEESFVPSFVRIASMTNMPSPRVASNHVQLRDAGGALWMDIQGLEVTSLGTVSSEDREGRTLFYQTRWLPCFELLSTNPHIEKLSMQDLVDIFTHQYPARTILYSPTSTDEVYDIVRLVGGEQDQRPRARQLDIYLPGLSVEESQKLLSLIEQSNGLVQVVSELNPTSQYDLILAPRMTRLDWKSYTPLLKEDGVALTPIDLGVGGDFDMVFSTASLSAIRRNQAIDPVTYKNVTVVVPEMPSDRVGSILASLRSSYPSGLSTTTLTHICNGYKLDKDSVVLILAALDGSWWEDAEAFRAIQIILTDMAGSRQVWSTEGSVLESSRPEQAMISGLIRSSRSENDQLEAVTFDFGRTSPAESIARNLSRLLSPGSFDEDEIAERDGCLFIPKVEADDERNVKLPNGPGQETALRRFGEQGPLSLAIGKVGLLETLHFVEDSEFIDGTLGEDELEIEVKASAINFRDIAASMGIIDDHRLGDECAGIVTAVGSTVRDFSIGDRVVAWRPGQGAHRSFVRNPASLCYRLRGDMDFADAAALPCILTTAYYFLVEVARLRAEDTVLIHSAAGGVGQMAIQIAQQIGARILVTVGSPAKRELLRDVYGLAESEMFNSRDDSFVQGVLQATGGKGVDVVLNSLAGPLLHASWGALNAFGRFIEIGKRDIHESTRISMEPFRKNVTFASVDLITMFERNKRLGAKVFQECCQMVHEGRISLPTTVLPLPYAEALKGFRLLQMGRHTGKVVLVPGEADVVPVLTPKFRDTRLLDGSKTYLLVGGLGGLGRTLSQWLVRKGAKSIAFFSRSGAEKPEAKQTVDWLQQRGISVQVFSGDVASLPDVTHAIRQIGPRLGGVLQAAMVLQDNPLDTMSFAQLERCLLPKVVGTQNLHLATLGSQLDFFVCFSSVATVLGFKGQANYSAANSFLDAFMRHRRGLGLCGTTMNIGAVGDAGVIAESSELQKTMLRSGVDTLTEQELMYQLEEALTESSGFRLTADGVDSHQIITGVGLLRPDVYWSSKPLLRNLYANHNFGDTASSADKNRSILAQLAEAGPEERVEILLDAFIGKIANILVTPRESILPHNTLSSYGLDSIVAVEFRKWFRKEINVDMALFDILGAPSIRALVLKAMSLIAAPTPSSVRHAVDTKRISEARREDTHDGQASSDAVGTPGSAVTAIPKATNVECIPLSSYQSRLWFLHSLADDKSRLNLAIVSHMSGTPSRSILTKALQEMVNRNAVLRTAYFEGNEFAQQKPVDSFEIDMEFADLSHDTSPDDALARYVEHAKSEELDLEVGEAARFSLVKLAESRYALVSVVHHISVDRGSYTQLMGQLVQLYNAVGAEKNLGTVAQPPLSYVDFTLWHNEFLRSSTTVKQVDWWKRELSGIPESCELMPFARSQRAAQGEGTGDVTVELNDKLFSRMKRLARQVNGTPYHFVLAALRAFIYRYTTERDLVVLTVDGNRPHPDVDDVAGFFVNLCPVRLPMDDGEDISFDALLRKTRDKAMEAIAHNTVPFDAIVEAVQTERTSSHFPIGQVVVNYQIHGPAPRFPATDFTIYETTMEDIPTACDLNLEALETADQGLNLRFEYATALYGEADMRRFADNFLTFLTSAIHDHHQPIPDIAMCGSLELDRLQSQFWNTEYVAPSWKKGRSVIEKIFDVAIENPSAIAIRTSDGSSITYGELVQKAERIASSLLSYGVKEGEMVGILLHPGIEAVAAMLGVLMTRAGYLALDTDFAQDRLAFMVNDAGVRIVLTGTGHIEKAGHITVNCPLVTEIFDLESARSHALLGRAGLPRRQPQDPFYMIYTSGSTGQPKGVVLTESNTAQMLTTLHKDFGFTARDRFLHHSSMSFDLSIVQIFSALTCGASICTASWETRKDPAALADFMRAQGVTVTYFTPTQYGMLMEANAEALRQCADYRVAFFAGERLPVRIAKAFFDLGTPALLYNTWSPSEVVVQTTVARIDRSDLDENASLPIGFPLDNCRHYILDARQNPVPVGVVGEIYVGGAQVGAGYRNRPKENSDSFVLDPFATQEDIKRGWTRMFKTGDTGCFRADGQLEFRGRVAGDKQIKLRGFRVDLGEVEQRILAEAAGLQVRLLDVYVVARPYEAEVEDGGDQLIAYVVPADIFGTEEAKEFFTSLHSAIAKHLNQYMLPSGYQLLDKLPATIGGKVDRQNLLTRLLDLIQPSSISSLSNDTCADTDELQRSVLALFQDILGIRRYVDTTDNFFEKGGNSLLLARLQAKLRREFGTAPPLSKMVQEPSAAAVSMFIKGKRNGDGSSTNVTIDWSAETTLPRKFAPRQTSLRPTREGGIDTILVAGAESSIGLHLVSKLLRTGPGVQIRVLGTKEELEKEAFLARMREESLLGVEPERR